MEVFEQIETRYILSDNITIEFLSFLNKTVGGRLPDTVDQITSYLEKISNEEEFKNEIVRIYRQHQNRPFRYLYDELPQLSVDTHSNLCNIDIYDIDELQRCLNLSRGRDMVLFSEEFKSRHKNENYIYKDVNYITTQQYVEVKEWSEFLHLMYYNIDFYVEVFLDTLVREILLALYGDTLLSLPNMGKLENGLYYLDFEIDSLNEIYNVQNANSYINLLKTTKPPILNRHNEFIGNKFKHKGVICGFIKDLQFVGIIKPDLNRQSLVAALNKNFKNLSLGLDGKTFDTVSKTYENHFKKDLMSKVDQLMKTPKTH